MHDNIRRMLDITFDFSDKLGNSVIGLDYSCCDEYLASLYDTGDINLYGLKTGVKMDLFRMDGKWVEISV